MKTTKHIKKLADKLAKQSAKDHLAYYAKHLTHAFDSEKERIAEYTESSAKLYREQLTHIKNALTGGRYYTRVETVSKSGMSRTIAIAYTHRNRLIHICDKLILDLAGVDKNGRIGGCGMDMLFAAQYNLFHSLHGSHKQAHYQKRMARYNSL